MLRRKKADAPPRQDPAVIRHERERRTNGPVTPRTPASALPDMDPTGSYRALCGSFASARGFHFTEVWSAWRIVALVHHMQHKHAQPTASQIAWSCVQEALTPRGVDPS